MLYELCMDCDYCDTNRKNEQGQVRCTRFSQFVNPDDINCEDYYDKEIDKFYHIIKSLERK